MKELKIFIIGAIGYGFLEILWRGKTHWSMLITGGFCFLIIFKMHFLDNFGGIFEKSILSAIVITSVELTAGSILNLYLKWNIWDYSALPLNFMGQICIPYSILWFALSFPLFFLCDFLEQYIL